MKKYLIFTFFITMTFVLLSGCFYSSTVQEVQFNNQGAPIGKNLNILPFLPPEKSTNPGVNAVFRGVIPLLADVIMTQKGVYNFNEKDFNNLKESLVNSLKKSNSFVKISEVDNIAHGADGLFLEFKFKESGTAQTATKVWCAIDAIVYLKNENGEILKEKIIQIKEGSIWTLSDVKNKAIKSFIKDVMQVIAS